MPSRPAGRRPARRARRPRRGSRRAARLPLIVVALLLGLFLYPPTRGAFAHAGDTLAAALEESRRADFRRVLVARQAVRYGISFELAADIERAATAEGIDPDLAFRLVRVESDFREGAVSPAGALGLTQLMPATAATLQPGITREEIFRRETNLRLGFRYLRWLLRVYDGRVEDALHAYNRGPGTVDRIRAAGGDPANGYADRVLEPGGEAAYRGRGSLD